MNMCLYILLNIYCVSKLYSVYVFKTIVVTKSRCVCFQNVLITQFTLIGVTLLSTVTTLCVGDIFDMFFSDVCLRAQPIRMHDQIWLYVVLPETSYRTVFRHL